MVFSCPLRKRGQPVGQEEAPSPTSGRLGPRRPAPRNTWLAGSHILQTCEHVGRRRQLAFRVTIALLFCAYSHCGPFLYEYIQAPTDLAEQMLSGNSTTSYSNLVFKLFAIPICNR